MSPESPPEPVPIAATPSALAELAAGMRPALWRYLRTLGADAATADDLVQQALLVVLQRADFALGAAGALFVFLRTTCRQLWQRRRPPQVSLDDIDDAHRVWIARCGDGRGDDYVDALRACVERLPKRSRALLAAFYEQDEGRTAAGDAVGLSPQGTKTALRRLRKLLFDCITRRLEASR